MSWVTLTEPVAGDAIYQNEGLLYEFTEQYPINSISDTGGKLTITTSSAGASAAGAAGTVYLDILEGEDEIDTAVAQVTSFGATSVVTDIDYDAGFSTTGNLRIIGQREITIQTKGTGRPVRTVKIRMKPDLKGIFKINAAEAAIARLSFNDPGSNQDQSHDVEIRCHPSLATPGSYVSVLKATGEGAAPAPTIAYRGTQGLVTELVNNKFVVNVEQPETGVIDPNSAGDDEPLYVLSGKEYRLNLSTPVADADTTITNNAGQVPYELVTSQGGQQIDAVIIKPGAAGVFNFVITEDDGVNPVVVYDYEVHVQETLTVKDSCAGARRLFWWSPRGGWVEYQFSLRETLETVGGAIRLVECRSQYAFLPAAYEDVQEQLSLKAAPESQAVFDALNDMAMTIEIYEPLNASLTSWKRWYLTEAKRAPKTKRPFLALKNRWSGTLVSTQVAPAINRLIR